MFEQENLSHLLDILGNRNRRRIVELLHEKPCFVTEISEQLSINPKAVIEHLALMQKEDVISFYQDEKRRKYYYLVQDFTLSVKVNDTVHTHAAKITKPADGTLPLTDKILMLKKLLTSRERMMQSLEEVERTIDNVIDEIVQGGRAVFSNNVEAEILLALVYTPLTPIELSDTCNSPIPEVTAALRSLVTQGYVKKKGGRYALVEPQHTN